MMAHIFPTNTRYDMHYGIIQSSSSSSSHVPNAITTSSGGSVVLPIRTLGPYDILFGRCKSAFNNIGNRRFRITIDLNLQAYLAIKSRSKKTAFFKEIADYFKNEVGARFLKPVQGGGYVELSQKHAREKIGHALRDLAVHRGKLTSISEWDQQPSQQERRKKNKKKKQAKKLPAPSRDSAATVDREELPSSAESSQQNQIARANSFEFVTPSAAPPASSCPPRNTMLAKNNQHAPPRDLTPTEQREKFPSTYYEPSSPQMKKQQVKSFKYVSPSSPGSLRPPSTTIFCPLPTIRPVRVVSNCHDEIGTYANRPLF